MPNIPPPVLSERPLNLRQQRFVVEYLVDGGAAAAARRAGFTPSQAKWQGARMLRLPKVRAALAAAREAQGRAPDRQSVREELRRIAFANVLDYARPEAGGELTLDLWKLDRDRASAVRELTVVERTDPRSGAVTRTVRFKLADKTMALARLSALLDEDRRLIEAALDRGHLMGVQEALDLSPERLETLRERYAAGVSERTERRLATASAATGPMMAADLKRARVEGVVEGRAPPPSALTADDLYGDLPPDDEDEDA